MLSVLRLRLHVGGEIGLSTRNRILYERVTASKGFSLDRKRIYRTTPRFRETVEDIQADRVIVRQIGPKEFIIVVNHPTADVEFVLATTRAPNEPRVSTVFGFACGVAVKTSGLTLAEFDLLDAPGEEGGD